MWALESLPWDSFAPHKVAPDLAKVVRAAALVEYGGGLYADYLSKIFAGDDAFCAVIQTWAEEEVQHGRALGRWAQLADPTYNLEEKYAAFRKGYTLDLGREVSARGSRAGELIARCMVETGTSSLYTALAESSEEPLLKAICQHIAADELRHYKLFYTHLQRYLEAAPLSLMQRVKIGLGRIAESEDDELSYAYYAANGQAGQPYVRALNARAYARRAFGAYQPHHISRAVSMVFKACGLNPQSWLCRATDKFAWFVLTQQMKKLDQQAA